MGGITPYVFEMLTLAAMTFFYLVVLLTSAYFIILSRYLKGQKKQKSEEHMGLKSAKEISEDRYENAKALIEELKNKNNNLIKLELGAFSRFNPQN